MVKYGSTVRIAVLPLYDNEPLYAIPVTLADTWAAQDTIKKGAEKIRDWLYREGPLLKKYQDITDDQLIELVKTRGLTIDAPVTKFAELYYFASRSGESRGHYIERFENNTVTCTCPGFKNRSYCWASSKVLRSTATGNKWASTHENFYRDRKLDYGV